LTTLGLYIVYRGGKRLLDRAIDDAADSLYDIVKSWAKRQFAEGPLSFGTGPQPKAIKINIFGPGDKLLKTIEVSEDDDDTADDADGG
jgi:hypothetical protein